MSPDCSKSNVCDGSRPLRFAAGTTISDIRRSPHFSSTTVGWHRGGPIVSLLDPASSVRHGPRSEPGQPADCPLIKLGFLDQATSLPEPFMEGEDRLVDIVDDLSVSDTRRALEYWRQTVDGPGPIRDQLEQMELRGISASKSLDGMIRVDGWMTTSAGLAFLAAIDAFMPPPSPDDRRTPRQRRHDALEDLARYFLDHGDTPTVGGEKPHINLVCDLSSLQGIAGGLHETENGHVLTVMELRALACDCSLSRIVLGPDGETIDVGRRTRVVPTALRRALIARDRHCAWKGCDRDPRWCDAHHIEHWANGGKTEPGNLKLLCRYHHSLTHLLENQDRGPPTHT